MHIEIAGCTTGSMQTTHLAECPQEDWPLRTVARHHQAKPRIQNLEPP